MRRPSRTEPSLTLGVGKRGHGGRDDHCIREDVLDCSAKQIPGRPVVGREGSGLKNLADSLQTNNVVFNVSVRAKHVEGHVERRRNGRDGRDKAIDYILGSFKETSPVVGQRGDILRLLALAMRPGPYLWQSVKLDAALDDSDGLGSAEEQLEATILGQLLGQLRPALWAPDHALCILVHLAVRGSALKVS